MDFKQVAADIVKNVGGKENIEVVSHCMTRLRLNLKDKNKADQQALREIDGVLGVVYAGSQLMVILGKNLLPVYDIVVKEFQLKTKAAVEEGPKKKEPLTLKGAGNAVLGYVSSAVTPMVTGLVAGGMLKVALLLVTLVWKDFSASATYTFLSTIADAVFYFMPIFVAYGAITKLGGTPIYAMLAAAALLHPDYTAVVAAGEAVDFCGVPVRLLAYSTSLLPALLVALVAYYAEKFFNKIVPGIFRSIFVGLGTITVTGFLAFTILGPIGNIVGAYLAQVFIFLGDTVGPVGVGVLTALLPWLVMCGMHAAIAPFMPQALVDPGYDALIRPAFILHNMAEGGACIGVALRTKNKEYRSETLGIAFGCIVAGVTEPAIYGVNLKHRRPMYGVMAGGAVGGIICGLFGARAYVMGYSTLLALPIFEDTFLAALAGMAAALVVSAVVTFILGIDEGGKGNSSERTEQRDLPDDADQHVEHEIVSIANGRMFPIEEVKDEAFSSKAMGDGVAFELEDDLVCAPVSGELTAVFPTGHAFGIQRSDGVEILIHIGINTVELDGAGFTLLAKQDDKVQAGDPIVKVDREYVKSQGYDLATMLIVTDANGRDIVFDGYGSVRQGQRIS